MAPSTEQPYADRATNKRRRQREGDHEIAPRKKSTFAPSTSSSAHFSTSSNRSTTTTTTPTSIGTKSSSVGGTATFAFDHSQRQPRNYTVSIAIPGSILDNAQNAELKTYLVGQVARAAAIFHVDEIIIFREQSMSTTTTTNTATTTPTNAATSSSTMCSSTAASVDGEFVGVSDRDGKDIFDPNTFMVRILQYLETPQ
jgi:hypothetical protein